MPDLTVLILTYNRPEDLLVSLRYWRLLEVSVVVADGSPSGPSIAPHLIPSNVIYFHDDSPPNIRTLKALDHLKTDFCVLIGDDEFHLSDGLHASLALLRANPSLAASIGQCVGFSVHNNIVFGGSYYEFPVFQSPPSLTSRIIDYFTSYLPVLPYAVWRTDIFKLANTISSSSQWGGENVCEWVNSLVCLSVGQIAVHDTVHWLRRHDNPTIGTSVSMKSWFSEPQYSDKVLLLRTKYIEAVNEFTKISKADLFSVFKLASSSVVFFESSRIYRQSLGDMIGKPISRDYNISIDDYLLSKGSRFSVSSLSAVTDLYKK